MGAVALRLRTECRSSWRSWAGYALLVGIVGALVIAAAAGARRTETAFPRALEKANLTERGQIWQAVAWQATTITAIAVVIGIPLGIAAGRWAWTIFSDQMGVAHETVVPVGLTLLVVPAALIVANLVALFPGRAAARTRPAVALRSE